MQLLEKNRTQFACLFILTTTTIYLSIYPFSALKLLSSLPWLALFAYVVVLGLSYQYKQGKVLFTALLMIAYQAVPLGSFLMGPAGFVSMINAMLNDMKQEEKDLARQFIADLKLKGNSSMNRPEFIGDQFV